MFTDGDRVIQMCEKADHVTQTPFEYFDADHVIPTPFEELMARPQTQLVAGTLLGLVSIGIADQLFTNNKIVRSMYHFVDYLLDTLFPKLIIVQNASLNLYSNNSYFL